VHVKYADHRRTIAAPESGVLIQQRRHNYCTELQSRLDLNAIHRTLHTSFLSDEHWHTEAWREAGVPFTQAIEYGCVSAPGDNRQPWRELNSCNVLPRQLPSWFSGALVAAVELDLGQLSFVSVAPAHVARVTSEGAFLVGTGPNTLRCSQREASAGPVIEDTAVTLDPWIVWRLVLGETTVGVESDKVAESANS